MKKSKLESKIINYTILSGLIFLQIVAPAFGFACNDFISGAPKSNQNYIIAENSSEKSCCAELELPAHGPAPQENEKHSSTTPCGAENCDTCLFFCCNSTAFMLTSQLSKAHCSFTSSIVGLASVFYLSPYLHGIYRPPRS